MKNKFLFLTFILAGCAHSYGEVVSGPLGPFSCNDKFVYPEAKNIDELIEQSSSIALYKVQPFDVSKSQNPITDNDVKSKKFDFETLSSNLSREYFIHQLKLEKRVFGNAPNNISLYGKYNPNDLNIELLDTILDHHSELVSSEDVNLGLAVRDYDLDGNCIYSGHFIPSVTYLIFEGGNSPAVYEPILDTKKDSFYLEVVNRVKSKGEK